MSNTTDRDGILRGLDDVRSGLVHIISLLCEAYDGDNFDIEREADGIADALDILTNIRRAVSGEHESEPRDGWERLHLLSINEPAALHLFDALGYIERVHIELTGTEHFDHITEAIDRIEEAAKLLWPEAVEPDGGQVARALGFDVSER